MKTEAELEFDMQIVKTLEEALKHMRLYSYFGIMKTIHKQLNLDDPNKTVLSRFASENKMDDTSIYIIQKYQWYQNMQNYKLANEQFYHGQDINFHKK